MAGDLPAMKTYGLAQGDRCPGPLTADADAQADGVEVPGGALRSEMQTEMGTHKIDR